MINWINEIWYSEDKITKKTIINGFIKAGIRKENDFENNVMNNIIIEEDVEYKNGDIDENKNDYFELEDDLDLEKIDEFNDN